MATVYGIKKRLEDSNVDHALIKSIISDGDLINIITRMEALLEPELVSGILDSCGCTGGKGYLKQCEQMGKALAGQTMEEKVRRLNDDPDSYSITLHNGMLTVTMSFMRDGQFVCVCSAASKNGVKVSDIAAPDNDDDSRVMPLSYCYCCGGGPSPPFTAQAGHKT